MAVVQLITALEDHFGISVDDDEIGASTFATIGSLTAFVEGKMDG
jgi:acyl carrier protein